MTRHEYSKEEETTDPVTPPLDHIHHIAVVVTDIEQGVRWYTENFHCTVKYVDASWALLKFANTMLALVLPREHPGHFAITRSDAENFGSLTTHRDGLQSTYIKDVAGNPLEILKSETHNTPSD